MFGRGDSDKEKGFSDDRTKQMNTSTLREKENKMKTLILLVVLAVVCCVPAFGHADSNPDTNLVMLQGVTCVSNGDHSAGLEGFNAILNPERTTNPQGLDFNSEGQAVPVWIGDFHSLGWTSPADIVTLTITFPQVVSITEIAWNSAGVCGNWWNDNGTTVPHWWATLDGAPLVDKDCDQGGLGTGMLGWYGAPNYQPHLYDPVGTQDERAVLGQAAIGSTLVLSFRPIDRCGDQSAWCFGVRDINVVGSVVPEPSSILALLTGCAGVASVIRRKRS